MRITRWSKVDTKWYLGVRCRKCRAPILFAVDNSDGAHPPAPARKLVLTCAIAECRHQADYSATGVPRFQKQTDAPKENGDYQ
jgi:hypothetical protein